MTYIKYFNVEIKCLSILNSSFKLNSHVGFDKLSRLRNLELSDNKFNSSVLASLTSLPHLETLSLASNKLEGRINIQGCIGLLGFFFVKLQQIMS